MSKNNLIDLRSSVNRDTAATQISERFTNVQNPINIISLLFKNKKLANVCNLQGGLHHDIIQELRDNTSSFLKKKKYNSSKVLGPLVNNRKAHKYAFMCLGYSQGQRQRLQS